MDVGTSVITVVRDARGEDILLSVSSDGIVYVDRQKEKVQHTNASDNAEIGLTKYCGVVRIFNFSGDLFAVANAASQNFHVMRLPKVGRRDSTVR